MAETAISGRFLSTLALAILSIVFTGAPKVSAQEACTEATVGMCFPEYSAIAAVARNGGGYAAIGVRGDGLDLLRVSRGAEITDRIDLQPPPWVQQEGGTSPDIEKLVAGPNDSLLLVGWVTTNFGAVKLQSGVVGLVDATGQVAWSGPLRFPETSTILYSGVYDPSKKRFLVVGRHTNGADAGKCTFWSQGLAISIPENDVSVGFPVHFLGAAEPGPQNRIALYDIAPTPRDDQFVASGFATARNAADTGCQDNALALLIGGGTNNDWNLSQPYAIGEQDSNEVAFSVRGIGDGRYLLAGQGSVAGTGARAALVAAFDFAAKTPGIRTDPVPENGSDRTGGDRYRVIVPLRTPGSFLVAGSASARREERNQGIWRIVSESLDSSGSMNLLTQSEGSDILGAALGPDGKVLAVGTHGQGTDSIGWMGLIHDQQVTAKRRRPDTALPQITPQEAANGLVTISEREIANGAGLRGARMAAGSGLELRFSLSQETDLAISALTAEGDLDVALLDGQGKVAAFSSNLNDAGEYFAARLVAGDYRVKLIAVSEVAGYEFRAVTGRSVEDAVMATLGTLDADARKALSGRLEDAGYGNAGNPDIAFGGDTVRSLLAYYNTFYAPIEAGAVERFIAEASLAGGG